MSFNDPGWDPEKRLAVMVGASLVILVLLVFGGGTNACINFIRNW